VALGVPGRLRPRNISTFGTTGVVGRQPYALAAFIPEEIPGTHFQRLSRPQGAWFCRKEPRKKSPVTPPGIDSGTVRLVAQRLNHYATPGPFYNQLGKRILEETSNSSLLYVEGMRFIHERNNVIQNFPLDNKTQEDQNTKIFKEVLSKVHSAAVCYTAIYDDKMKGLEKSPLHKY
jgi:hypothetical protein